MDASRDRESSQGSLRARSTWKSTWQSRRSARVTLIVISLIALFRSYKARSVSDIVHQLYFGSRK